MRRSTSIALVTTLFRGMLVQAQAATNATCSSNFGWMNNTLDQSPCLVAAYLQGACLTGAWTVPALPQLANGQQQAYNPPDSATRSLCVCSHAVYNLMSACAACQGEAWYSWGLWETNCVTPNNLVSSDAFPSQIPVPGGTKIPKYAAQDPQSWTGMSFNATEAQSIGSQDFVATPTSSSSSSTNSTSSTTPSNTTASNEGNSNGPPVGPIVGGVVGGVLGILLIAVFATYLLCPGVFTHRRGRNANQSNPLHPTDEIPRHPGPSTGTPSTGMQTYDASTIYTASRSHLVAPIPTRPALLTLPSTASYSTASVDHSMPAPSVYSHSTTYTQQQHALHSSPPTAQQYPNDPVGLSPPATSSTIPSSSTSQQTMTHTPSIRSFLTRVTTRAGHIHSSSESTVTSSTSLLPWSLSNNNNGSNSNSNNSTPRAQESTPEHIVPYVLLPTSNSLSAPLASTLTSSASAPPAAVPTPAQVQTQDRNHIQPYVLDHASASQQSAGDRKQHSGPAMYGPVEDRSIQTIHGMTMNVPFTTNTSTATAVAATSNFTAEPAYGAYNPIAAGVGLGDDRIDEANGENGMDGLDGIDRRTNNMSPANASSILDPAPSYAVATQIQPRPYGQTGPAAQHNQTLQGVAEYPEEKARFSGREPEM